MEQKQRKAPSDIDIFQALFDAQEKYKELLKINELISESEIQTVQESYYRDIHHPLSITIKE
jgi:hypothetical protein